MGNAFTLNRLVMTCKDTVYLSGNPYYRLLQTPTQSLYWLNCWIDEGIPPDQIVKLGQNAYLKKEDGIYFSRVVTSREFQDLKEYGVPLNYLIDDDYEAMAVDPTIPEYYRTKIEHFSQGVFRQICTSKSVRLYAASMPLAKRYACPLKEPFWLPGSNRVQHGSTTGKMIRLAFLSSASHLNDFIMMAKEWLPELNEALMKAGKRASITHYLKSHVSAEELPVFSKISWKHHFALSWKSYLREIPKAGYHAVLYPMTNTPVNASRSRNKIIEAEMRGIPLFTDLSQVTRWVNEN